MAQKQDGRQVPQNIASGPIIFLCLFKEKNHEPHNNAGNPRKKHHAAQPRTLPRAADSDFGNDHPSRPR